MPSILQALAWWESLELATQLFHGAEGEEDEVVGGAGASIMVEAMAKEVKKKPKTKHTHLHLSRHTTFSSQKVIDTIDTIYMIVRVSKNHLKCVSFSQVDLERMVTGTALTPDTVSTHFSHYSPSLAVYSFSGLRLKGLLPNVLARMSEYVFFSPEAGY